MIRRYRQGLRDISNVEIPWENPFEVWEDPSGAYTVQRCASQWDWWLESYFLAHCLGTKNYEEFSKNHVVYSIRDKVGVPHATILCVREDCYSPYGRCWDIGSVQIFTPEEEPLRVLQVRGRNDAIAHPIFHAIARDWYVRYGGRIEAPIESIVNVVMKLGDDDLDYHFRYMLDERNGFLWTHWNERMRVLALMEGTSL